MPPIRDLVAIVICTLAWGTTWYAITLQLGVVDPIVSLAYRFGLAAIVLLLWCAARGERIGLSPSQHRAALGIGFFQFTIDYALIYWAEARVASAVVAVIFAALSFVNLVAFRLAFGHRAPRAAWVAAGLGAVGVGFLSWGELTDARLDRDAVLGLSMALGAVPAAALGNIFARRGEVAGAPIASSTAWAMGYGAALLALFAMITGRPWAFEMSVRYVASLLHLSVVGSVVAFLLYYGLARRRGYATAAYISALTPPLAMLMSTLFEGKAWGPLALGGVVLVLIGQWLLLRVRKS